MPLGPGAEDATLRTRVIAGDPAAFESLVRLYGPRMLTVARRILGNDDDAADAVQEAFLSAFRSLGRFESQSSLGTWLHRIAVNAALMRLRTRRRRPERSIDELLPTFKEDGHRNVEREAWTDCPEVLLARRETASLIRAKIDELPCDYRTVLILRDIEGLDTEDTATYLGLQVGAVKTRLHRARMALRELLESELAP